MPARRQRPAPHRRLGFPSLSDDYWRPFIAAGGKFRWFNPFNLSRFGIRNHRKLLVCDDRTAFVGGFNIAPEYQGDGVTRGWRDLGLRLDGELAEQLGATFDELFNRAELRLLSFDRLLKLVKPGTRNSRRANSCSPAPASAKTATAPPSHAT